MTLDKVIHKVNVIVAVGNIINLILFPIAVFHFRWTQDDPRLVLLGHLSMFFVGWMTSTYIMFLFKEKKEHEKDIRLD